jgi:hypothetical protein
MSEQYTQTITRCAAGRGWLWWVEAFRLVKDAVGPWFLIGLGFLGVLMVLSILISILSFSIMAGANSEKVPLIGYLPIVLLPCLVVGFVAAGWSQARGEKPQFSQLFSGFKADVKTLLIIGVVLMVLSWLCDRIFIMMLGEDFIETLKNIIETKDPVAITTFLLTALDLKRAVFIYAALITLVWMVAWLAPMVVVFQRTGAMWAMWSSFKALSINWRALLIYILVPSVGGIVFMLVLGIVLGGAGGVVLSVAGPAGVVLLSFLSWGILLLSIPLMFSLVTLTAFVAYCDIFHAKDAVFPRPPKKAAL